MKRIVFIIVPLVLLVLAFRSATTITVTGKILDDKSNPVNGASIMVKGTKNGTASLFDGSFSLIVANSKVTLIISSIGFKTQEIILNGKSVINVTLSAAENQLAEVVVIGNGLQRKRSVTGSMTKVSGEQVSPYSAPISTQLQGKVAGLQINGSSGSGAQIRLRGLASRNARPDKDDDGIADYFNTTGYDKI